MVKIELIYEKTCPNAPAARSRLMRALRQASLPAKWREWEVGDPAAPAYARRFGSPTILINGKDVAGAGPMPEGNSCRLYKGDAGYEPAPDAAQITRALLAATPEGGGGLRFSLLPAVGLALLPKLTCPVCWPAYTALLSSLGIGFVDYTPYVLPLLIIFLSVSLVALAFGARGRRGYGPFWLGLFGGTGILMGKYVVDSQAVLYWGGALLVAAALWNIWPRKIKSAEIHHAQQIKEPFR